jgi:hypothetical protein
VLEGNVPNPKKRGPKRIIFVLDTFARWSVDRMQDLNTSSSVIGACPSAFWIHIMAMTRDRDQFKWTRKTRAEQKVRAGVIERDETRTKKS